MTVLYLMKLLQPVKRFSKTVLRNHVTLVSQQIQKGEVIYWVTKLFGFTTLTVREIKQWKKCLNGSESRISGCSLRYNLQHSLVSPLTKWVMRDNWFEFVQFKTGLLENWKTHLG